MSKSRVATITCSTCGHKIGVSVEVCPDDDAAHDWYRDQFLAAGYRHCSCCGVRYTFNQKENQNVTAEMPRTLCSNCPTNGRTIVLLNKMLIGRVVAAVEGFPDDQEGGTVVVLASGGKYKRTEEGGFSWEKAGFVTLRGEVEIRRYALGEAPPDGLELHPPVYLPGTEMEDENPTPP